MRVYPRAVRATQLHVHEQRGRLPPADQRPPPERHAPESKRVLDLGPGPHHDRQWRQGPEAELRRRDRLKVRGIGEEGEDAVQGNRQHQRRLDHAAVGDRNPTYNVIRQARSSSPKRVERNTPPTTPTIRRQGAKRRAKRGGPAESVSAPQGPCVIPPLEAHCSDRRDRRAPPGRDSMPTCPPTSR